MCLLREILFTGINAFYTQASVGTLSRGLELAGTCAAGVRNSTGGCGEARLCRWSLIGVGESGRLEIYDVFETDRFSSNQDAPDAAHSVVRG